MLNKPQDTPGNFLKNTLRRLELYVIKCIFSHNFISSTFNIITK